MSKGLIYFSIFIFGTIGSYLPSLFGQGGMFSMWGIIGGTIGSIFGIWAAIKLKDYI